MSLEIVNSFKISDDSTAIKMSRLLQNEDRWLDFGHVKRHLSNHAFGYNEGSKRFLTESLSRSMIVLSTINCRLVLCCGYHQDCMLLDFPLTPQSVRKKEFDKYFLF